MFEIGSRLAGYEIVARLRAGGMANLFLAKRQGVAGFARHVAIKVIHPHLASDATFVRMFVDEALLSAKINHPNVVHVEELGEADGTYFLVMEYVHGCSLSQLNKELRRRQRRLVPEVAVYIAMRVAEGLHAAHETVGENGEPLGVVHRDVSPQNVLLAYKGYVKLIDFGIAKARGRAQETATRTLKGKIRYMAPEQAFGKPVDRRTDVYSLGILLWEMLTMQRLFDADDDFALLDQVRKPHVVPPHEIVPEISPALSDVVMKALAAAPEDRPETALRFSQMLSEAMPAATNLDADQFADLIAAVMAEELKKQKRVRYDSISGVAAGDLKMPAGPRAQDLEEPRSVDVQSVLMTRTHSAPKTDPAIEDDESAGKIPKELQAGRARRESASASVVVPVVRHPWVPIALAAVIAATVVAVGGVIYLRWQDGDVGRTSRDDRDTIASAPLGSNDPGRALAAGDDADAGSARDAAVGAEDAGDDASIDAPSDPALEGVIPSKARHAKQRRAPRRDEDAGPRRIPLVTDDPF